MLPTVTDTSRTGRKVVDILFVEDNITDAELAKIALGKFEKPIAVDFVVDGTRALDYVFERASHGAEFSSLLPKVIFLDVKLPRLNGMEVLSSLKADIRTRCVPVVMFSSSSEARDIRYCYDHGANGYVVKPVEYHAYTECILDLCRYWLTINCPPFN